MLPFVSPFEDSDQIQQALKALELNYATLIPLPLGIRESTGFRCSPVLQIWTSVTSV